jgi:hypothetical protein
MAIAVVLAIGLIVLAFKHHQVAERKAIMGGNEIDAAGLCAHHCGRKCPMSLTAAVANAHRSSRDRRARSGECRRAR